MKRRELMLLLASAMMAPHAPRAQRKAMPVIGILSSGSPNADAGPTPGMSCITRNPAMPSRGFSTNRSNARMSLICAVSRNLRPPYLTKGIFRRVSSTNVTLG